MSAIGTRAALHAVLRAWQRSRRPNSEGFALELSAEIDAAERDCRVRAKLEERRGALMRNPNRWRDPAIDRDLREIAQILYGSVATQDAGEGDVPPHRWREDEAAQPARASLPPGWQYAKPFHPPHPELAQPAREGGEKLRDPISAQGGAWVDMPRCKAYYDYAWLADGYYLSGQKQTEGVWLTREEANAVYHVIESVRGARSLARILRARLRTHTKDADE